MGKILSEEEHQKKFEEEILKIRKKWDSLTEAKKTKIILQNHKEQCQAIEKLFKYVDEYPLENQSHFEKKLSKIQEDINNGKNLRDVTDWDFLWLHLLKIANHTLNSKQVLDIVNCCNKASSILKGFDINLECIFYDLYEAQKSEEKRLENEKTNEKRTFKNAIEIVKYYIPTFTNGKYEKVIKKKRVDLLGKCSKTGKYIIVEFKKGFQDATNQLYGYDRVLGGGNILVSLTETDPNTKYDGVIYLNLEQYKKDTKSLK